MKSVIIAGGTSFIGCHLIKSLLDMDYNVTAIIRPETTKKKKLPEVGKKLQIIELDMKAYNKLDDYIESCDCFIPLSWGGTQKEERDNEVVNKNSSYHLFEGVKSVVTNAGCRRIICIGTQAEYGQTNGKITELTRCVPDTAYGRYKLEFYHKVQDYAKIMGVDLVELRLFSIYGSGDSGNKFIYEILSKLKSNKDILVSECSQIWDFLHVNDVVRAINICLSNSAVHGYYNISSGNLLPLKGYIEEMKRIQNSKSRILYGAIPYKKGIIPNIDFDCSRFMIDTGWKPEINFADGIKQILNEY